MAITAATRQDIIELCVIANNEAPGVTLLASLTAESEAGKSLTQIAETLATSSTFTTEYPSIQTSTEFATEFLNTLLPEVGAAFVTAGIPLVEAHINGGGSIGALIAICQDVYFDWKTVIYIYVCRICRTQFMLPNSSRR